MPARGCEFYLRVSRYQVERNIDFEHSIVYYIKDIKDFNNFPKISRLKFSEASPKLIRTFPNIFQKDKPDLTTKIVQTHPVPVRASDPRPWI